MIKQSEILLTGKKVLVSILLIINLTISSFAGTWASSVKGGIIGAFQDYDQFVEQQNEKIKSKYNSKRNLFKNILQQHKIKEEHLRNIALLNVYSSLEGENELLELERFKRLKDKQGDE